MFRVRIRSPQDFGAAVVFVLIGLAGWYFGRDLDFGSASRMGPGYFPTILSLLIAALGLGLGARSLAVKGPGIERVQLRPIVFVIGVVLAFGYLLNAVGLALTTLVLTVVVAFARREVNLVESVLLGAGLAIFVVAVFVYALAQPLPAWWGAP
jgi:hypothetical protein